MIWNKISDGLPPRSKKAIFYWLRGLEEDSGVPNPCVVIIDFTKDDVFYVHGYDKGLKLRPEYEWANCEVPE